MIAYSYGQRYTDMICVIVPSQKGIKLSFYKGIDLPDPEKILQGTAKTTRYLQFKSARDVNEKQVEFFLNEGTENVSPEKVVSHRFFIIIAILLPLKNTGK